jgi:hypothetical protein
LLRLCGRHAEGSPDLCSADLFLFLKVIRRSGRDRDGK